jgi:hypothetical protein
MLSEYNFNLNPYYDDFDRSKGYYRILFKPGFAVQARELTQLQTQLQNQIASFGDHVFKNGSMVLGGNFTKVEVSYITVSRENDILNFTDQEFTGQTSGAKGKVIKTVVVNDEKVKVFFTYTNGIEFQLGEVIICTNGNTETITSTQSEVGYGTAFSIDESVFYIYGNFVYCDPQTIIIAEDQLATARVGLFAEEFITASSSDSSLLDPALGSYNYSAPGADRYSISLILVSYAYDPLDISIDGNASENFIELARYVDGEKVSSTELPQYSELQEEFARRTFDESGNYTVTPFRLKITDNIFGNTDLLSVQIDPGKAYIKGYEFETKSPVHIDMPRSRTTSFENEFPVYVNYGNFFYVQRLKGNLDFLSNPTVNIYNNINASGTPIGNCRVKYIEYDSKESSNIVYKLYVDTINLSSTNSVSDILSFNVSNFQANVHSNSYSSGVNVTGATNNSYIIRIPKEYVESVNSAETSYTTTVKLPSTAAFSPSGGGSVSTVNNTGPSNQSFFGSGLLDESSTRELFILTVATTTNAGVIPVGTVLDYTTHQLRVTIDDENTISVTTNINVSFTASVHAKVFISGAIRKTKALVLGSKTISGASLTKANLSGIISLSTSDCFALSNVVINTDQSETVEYTNRYEFFTGQTDTLYDHGYIRLKPGYTDPITDDSTTGNITSFVVNFSYFTHSGTDSGFFDVGSYSDYDSIPIYVSSSGQRYNLRDCFDFRPRRIDNSTSISPTSALLAEPTTAIVTDFNYYIGRIDKLILTQERKFALIQGVPSTSPRVPVDIPDSMNLYVINVPPYTQSRDNVTFTYIENKRYTMRDIGKIEKRVERLEYYTSLSLLEKQASDESIPSGVPSIDRFKNGILVDPFAGHSVGDVADPDYTCSIDYNNRILRPRFSSQSYEFDFVSGTNHNLGGELVTLSYDTEVFLNQPLASKTVNLNPYLVFNWNGIVDLFPSTDTWVDTTTKPDVIVNLNGENDVFTILADNVRNPASVGVRYSDWQVTGRGITDIRNDFSTSTAVTQEERDGRILETTSLTVFNNQTTTVSEQIARVGLQISTGAVQTITKDIGTKVVDTSISPFIRSRSVNFYARSMKPSTDLFATFDGVNVSFYCFPATEIVLTNPNNINRNADSVYISNSSNAASIIFASDDRIFVRENGEVFQTGNTITWLVKGVISGTASVANVIRNSNLKTNVKGEVAGTFIIPNNEFLKFNVGEKLFRLSDTVGQQASTAAATKYVAQGLSQSLEKTLVSTRVATTSINPILDTTGSSSRSFSTSSVIGTTSLVVDVTPPPPPPPPPPPIPCTFNENGGVRGSFTYAIFFGSNTGACGITFDRFSTIPERYTIIWDGVEHTTGFVGSRAFNDQLTSAGFPNATDTLRNGELIFSKTKQSPEFGLLRIDAPIEGTSWRYRVVCPNDPITYPNPVTTGSMSLSFAVTPTFQFDWNQRNQQFTTLTVTATVVTTGTSAEYVRIANLAFTQVGTSTNYVISNPAIVENPVGGILTLRTTPDRRQINRRTGSVQFTIRVPRPVNNLGQYVLDLTGSSSLFTDAGYTTPTGLTSSGSTRFTISRNDAAGEPAPVVWDPVAQTFYVNPNIYPNGVFIESIDLFFKKKSTSLPVVVEVRPVVNGYPSARDIVPFGICVLNPSEVEVSEDASVPTNFKFPCPIYLPPGEHSFVALCNTTEYEIYTAVLGDFELTDPTKRITEQPNIGSMFKSQNSFVWTPIQEEDVMFRINKCVFREGTANAAVVTLNTNFNETSNVLYDLLFVDGENLDFASTDIKYAYKTKTLNGVLDANFTDYQLGSNVPMNARKILGQPNDLQLQLTMATNDRNITPVVDLGRLSSVLVQNIVNNGQLSNYNFFITNFGEAYSANANVIISGANTSPASAFAYYNPNTAKLEIIVTNSGEGYTDNVSAVITRSANATANAIVIVQNEVDSQGQGGNALARYITRKVTLAPGFESADLKVYLSANIPTDTSIKVFYKVAILGTEFFEEERWYPMVVESSGTPSETGFVEYKYRTQYGTAPDYTDSSALPTGETFKTFSVKIVMYSSNPVRVPQVKDLRVLALDD